ncbi:MAG: hypothetical protein QM530_04100 [Phycisphaerales bacterium]|nr:hypothetical protein [Phycisphaerales bacterium]
MKKISFFIVLFINSFDLTAQDLYLNIFNKINNNTVKHKQELLKQLDIFLKEKNDTSKAYNFFTSESKQKWGGELVYDLYQIEYIDGIRFFEPTVLGVIDFVPEKKYLLKIAYTSNDDSIHNSIRAIYNLVANYDSIQNNFTFEKYTDLYIKNWYTTKIGNIVYYKQSSENFSKKNAERLNHFNDSIAHFFGVSSKKITYFSCTNPIELMNLQGFDFVYNMFLARNGGYARRGGQNLENIIYAANNSEYYPHELVHLYLNDYDNLSNLASEGIATLLGGSSEKPLTYHLKILSAFLKKNNDYDLKTLLTSNIKIDNDVSTLYAIGGLLAKLVYEQRGRKGLVDFLKIPLDQLEIQLPMLLGVPTTQFHQYLILKIHEY